MCKLSKLAKQLAQKKRVVRSMIINKHGINAVTTINGTDYVAKEIAALYR